MLEGRQDELEFQAPIVSDTIFKAKTPVYSLYCEAIILLYDYCALILIMVVVVSYLYIKIRGWKQERQINKLARNLYNDVKKSLESNVNGLSESDILRKYISYPRSSNDKLPRTEEAFRSIVFKKLEELRKKDKQRVTSDETL